MKLVHRYKKFIAAFFLVVLTTELLVPNFAYGLTSGPSQPEMKGFEPIGNSDMVDLFSGDFSYNIPLMDVGGYPVNLAYNSGAGMDDEASWVGYGWGLNVGSLNRNLRGIPDDFNGTDKQEREMNMKDHKTYGGKFSMTLDLLGVPVDKIIKKGNKKKKLDLSLTLSVGVKYDNYRGIGAEVGTNAGLSLTEYTATPNTAAAGEKSNADTTGKGLFNGSFGLNLSSQDGANLSLNSQILQKQNVNNDKLYGYTSSIGFGYNTRTGLSDMTLGGSFSITKQAFEEKKTKKIIDAHVQSSISFNGNTYSPTIDHPTKTNSYNFSLHVGPELGIAFPGIGVSGFYSKQTVAQKLRGLPTYGYLHLDKGKLNSEAIVDFNREKDIPYSNEVKYLPIAIPTYDLFSATSQDGGGQYRLYRGSSGVFFDPKTKTTSDNLSLGIEFGAGLFFDAGADLYKQDINSVTKKWTARNDYLNKGDFQSATSNNPLYEPVYFKRVGEPVPYDKSYGDKIKNTSPVAVSLKKNITDAVAGAHASDQLRTKTAEAEATSVLKRDKREVRNTTFSYLTAKEASNHALDKNIKDHHPDSLVISGCNSGGVRNTFNRAGSYRKGHHFSEFTVTGDDGKRSIYGIPVYNTYQEEVTFSIDQDLSLRNKGLISYTSQDNSVSNQKGRENYFSKEKTPAYVTSYLLSAILSPDYVDRSGNGITDDDLGTAVKFNYSQLTNSYKWRTPFAFGADTANYNEGFMSDALDDKANYVYGEKEIWYLHSIESKTMVAHFVTEDRFDALGVTDNHGEVDASLKLKRLKEIRLYSKSDLRMNGNDPSKTVPIKVVHFVYDYSICKGLPNSVDNTGKLTLKRVFFTFGLNQKGKLNPYDFQYDTTYNFYNYRQYDRWGNFKDAERNPGGLNNSEFPYTIQDKAMADSFASAWQLKKIILPSGGNININYESDDYAFVQDKRASQMCMLNGVGTQGTNHGLVGADYIYVNLPDSVYSQKEMLERYFEGITNLYYKFLIDLDARGHKEFVPGYAEIVGSPELIGYTIAKIRLKKINKINPIAKAGWQFIRTNLPKYAYPGSDNLESNEPNLRKAIEALVTAFGNIKELIGGFEKRAKNKGYSNNVDLEKSWVRLCSPEWKKLGGGSRVKRIDISDDWAAMSGATGAQTSVYSQVYDYTTKDAKNRIISSGVASYEPILGNDENPFRQPIRYKQNQFLALNNYYYIEEPFGESFFPGASVGYCKVSVKTIGTGDEETVNRTGTVISEFYTAKDYPTIIDILGLEHRKPIANKLFKLIGAVSFDVVGLSQGYSVETNDMHGKPKSVHVFNKSGQKISSVEYYYKSANELTARKQLKNDVKVVNPDATISDGTIGMDVEMFTDMREETTDNLGISVKVSGGSGAILIFPLPFFFPGIGVNYDRRNFRSSSSIKIINRFAIQYKTVKMENGSTITSENLLWDAETGNVLLTKTQNEFDDPIYSFAYPAHWKYDGMGQAYKNLGTVINGFSTSINGEINTSSIYNSLLVPGDELIDINSGNKYWVINTNIGSTFKKRLINSGGELQEVSNLTVRLLRSGRRNMANTAIATIVSLNNPIVDNRLVVNYNTLILDAKASVFDEDWSVPVNFCATCPEGYVLSDDGAFCYKDTEPTEYDGCFTVCAGDTLVKYAGYGTLLYDTGYNINGTGDSVLLGVPFWKSGCSISNRSMDGGKTNSYIIDSSGTKEKKTNRSNEVARNIPDSCDLTPIPHSFPPFGFCPGPLNRTSIWSCQGYEDNGDDSTRLPVNKWIGFSRCINVPESKIYYVGMAGDNFVRFKVNGVTKVELLTTSEDNFRYWHIYPVFLSQGINIIEMEASNYESGGDPGRQAAFGAEIYNNTYEEMAASYSYDVLNVIFSTADMIGQQLQLGQFECEAGALTCDSPYYCRQMIPVERIVNPYYAGLLGNWRPKSSYVYQIARENFVTDPAKFGSTNIRKSGAYSDFNPFWAYDYDTLAWDQNPGNDNRWIAANEMTNFNAKGLEVENKDALNRYSSAVFGYLESMPVAVASNSRYREIAYDGFEDYGFILDCAGGDTCSTIKGHFNFRNVLNGTTIDTTNRYAHSGKHSLELNGAVSIVKSVYTGNYGSTVSIDNMGRYTLGPNELIKGFSPMPGRKYALSFWVRDGSPRDATTTVQASVNGMDLLSSSTAWPVVEGWKRIETQFMLPAVATSFDLEIESGGIVYIDDIRIHPFDGQMKTFAYDPSSQRLWAEMDENNFATFYEYDDEGILIRVKKETERGIMTIKETRSSYRKRPIN